ncbi:hypothetical protein V6N11_063253 [Hibiscus sabdariffa]|uniref:Uncharacterized protein n=2 Tax=Hibiscus sabdariffa TaxID=183260 RepID=A0ABR1ZP95_9ROSI
MAQLPLVARCVGLSLRPGLLELGQNGPPVQAGLDTRGGNFGSLVSMRRMKRVCEWVDLGSFHEWSAGFRGLFNGGSFKYGKSEAGANGEWGLVWQQASMVSENRLDIKPLKMMKGEKWFGG